MPNFIRIARVFVLKTMQIATVVDTSDVPVRLMLAEMMGDEENACSSCHSSPTSTSSVSTSSRGQRGERYKTELCRQFEESGRCCYGARCQFAHGRAELRSVMRHPKYKTDLCRTFHTTGLCPYGPRCHFIHNVNERRNSADSAFGLDSLRAPLMNVGIEFEAEQRLLGLVLLAFDPAVTVPHTLRLSRSEHHSLTALGVEELVDGSSSLSRSCGSVASSSRSTSRSASLGDIFSCRTLIE